MVELVAANERTIQMLPENAVRSPSELASWYAEMHLAIAVSVETASPNPTTVRIDLDLVEERG